MKAQCKIHAYTITLLLYIWTYTQMI